MSEKMQMSSFRGLLIETRDGDWGKAEPSEGLAPYRVIRGGDFESVRLGDVSRVPLCYLDPKSASRRTLRDQDILIETAGGTKEKPTGRSLLVTKRILDRFDHPATCASFARFLRVDPAKAVPGYVYWFLQGLYQAGEMWQHQVQHTGVARFQFTKFADSVSVPLPNTNVQHVIAHILGTLDDKIELNRRTNETLEAMARAIFKSWFVDFDPVRAKASGEPPESICRRLGLSPDVLALFPDSFQDSELGEIPSGWEIKGLDGIASYLNGLALQKFPADDDGAWLPVIKIAQLRAGHTKTADRASEAIPKDYVIQNGDVLFSWSGSLEVEIWCGGEGALNQHLFKVTSQQFPKWFYYLWTKNHLESFRLIAANKATTMGHIQRKHLSEAKVVVPALLLIESMSSILAPIIDQFISNKLESSMLAKTRDTLLPKLLSGELPSMTLKSVMEAIA
ncbi:MAG: restriction endonuclease subunit S [Azonexus sp.]|nr:restriction endonuclease subunit S [Azonexus sp.]